MSGEITREFLITAFSYDRQSGRLIRTKSVAAPGGGVGEPFGYIRGKTKFRQGTIDGVTYALRQLVWLYHHGELLGRDEIRHRNLDVSDDRIENLERIDRHLEDDVELTPESVRRIFDYHPETGHLTWRVKIGKSSVVGKRAGSLGHHGHWIISYGGRDHLAQRVVWMWVKGETPPKRIQTLDGNKLNNRIENLAPMKGLNAQFDYWTPEGRSQYGKAHRAAFPDHHRDKDLRRTFGITLEEYKAMLVEQSGVCAICHNPETEMRGGKLKALAVDHCHNGKGIRGLLCTACNKGLGHFLDDPRLLRAAATYIETHEKRCV